MMTPETKEALQRRLQRVSGQIGGIQRMVESDRYCIDTLNQLAAVRAALAQVSKLLLESHIQTCVRDAFDHADAEQRAEKIAELIRVFDKQIG